MTYAVILQYPGDGQLEENRVRFFPGGLNDAVAWRDRHGDPDLKVFRVEPVGEPEQCEPHRQSYVALVAALRAEFEPTALAALWTVMRQHRYDISSAGALAQAVHDANDTAYIDDRYTAGDFTSPSQAATR